MEFILGGLLMLGMAAFGLSLLTNSIESIGKSKREWKEVSKQRDFYKANPGATQQDYIQHYIEQRQPSRPFEPSTPVPGIVPTAPSNVRVEGEGRSLTLVWDPSTSRSGVDYYTIYFYDPSGALAGMEQTDGNQTRLPLAELLDWDIPDRFAEIVPIAVGGAPGLTSRRIRIHTSPFLRP